MPDVNIVESLEDARNRLRTALTNAGRDPASAHLLAVSKTQPAASVRIPARRLRHNREHSKAKSPKP